MPARGRPVFVSNEQVTTSTTANQVIASYLVSAGMRFHLLDLNLNVRLTTFASTATYFGTASLVVNGVTVQTFMCAGPGVLQSPIGPLAAEGLPIVDTTQNGPGATVQVVCTPASTTSYTWEANIAGYEV